MRSEVKPKPAVTPSLSFSRALRQLPVTGVLIGSGLSVSFVIGGSDH